MGGKVSLLVRILRGYLGNTRMSLTLAARVATIFEVVVLTHRTSPRLLPETRLDVLVVRLTTRPPLGVTGILGSGTGKVIPQPLGPVVPLGQPGDALVQKGQGDVCWDVALVQEAIGPDRLSVVLVQSTVASTPVSALGPHPAHEPEGSKDDQCNEGQLEDEPDVSSVYFKDMKPRTGVWVEIGVIVTS